MNELLHKDETYRIIGALNATGLEVGLLVNFGHHPKLEYERLVNTKKRSQRKDPQSTSKEDELK